MKTSTHFLYGMVMTSLLCSPAWAAEKVGVVGAAGATLTIIGENQQARSAKTGDDVFLGDVLKTDGSGKAQVVFLDRSSITLKPNSDLTVDSFVYDPSNESGKLALKSAKGAFRFIGGALSKKKPVTLTTPVGTIGIRGGIADTSISANGETDAFFLYGEEMSISNANGEQVSTKQYGTGITLDSSTAIPQAASVQQVAAHLDGFRPSTNDPALPGAPDAGEIDQKMDIDTDSQSPLAGAGEGAETSVASNSTGSDDGGEGSDGGDGGDGGAGNSDSNAGGDSSTSADSSSSTDASTGTESSSSPAPQESASSGPAASPSASSAAAPSLAAAPTLDAPSALPWLSGGGTSNAPIQTSNVINTATQTSTDSAVTFVARSGNVESGGTLSSRADNRQVILSPRPVANTTGSNTATTPTYQYFGRYNYRTGAYDSTSGEYETYRLTSGGIQGNLGSDGNYSLRFNEKLPIDGNTYTKTLARTPVTGLNNPFVYYASPGADLAWDGKLWTGWVVGSDSGSFQYYQLQDYLNPSQQFSMVLGTPVLQGARNIQAAIDASRTISNLDNTGNVAFFDFLPSFFNHHDGVDAQNDIGFLDYRIFQNATTLAQYNTTAITNTSHFGMATNWNMKTFFTSNLQWDSSATSSPYIKTAFGKINPDGGASGANYFDGRVYDYEGIGSGTALSSLTAETEFDYENGIIRADRNIYGTATNGIEGVMLNLNSATGQNDSQMAVRVNSGALSADVNVAAQQVSANTAVKAQFGFAGGAYIKDAGAGESNTLNFISNRNVQNVSVSQAPDGQVGARIIADNRSTAATDDVIVAKFGYHTGRESAYVADKIWGAQQGVVMDTTKAAGLDAFGAENYNTGVTSTTGQGSIIGATFSSVTTPTCTTCQFVQWGVWAGNQEMGAGRVDVANMIPVVVGEVTQNVGAKTLTGGATYAGPAYGTFAKTDAAGTRVANVTGNVNAAINLSTKTFAAGAIDISFASVHGAPLHLTNYAAATINPTGNAVNSGDIAVGMGSTANPTGIGSLATSGSMNVALFGPNAENIGGNFYARKVDYYGASTALEGAGVFLGSR